MADRADIETWIARTALGDRSAFSALYDATSAKLFGICLRVLKDRALAEDALQEVYVKVWGASDRYAAGGPSPMSWLITIARNHAIDRLRSQRASGGAALGSGGGRGDEGGDAPLDAAAFVADDAPGPEAAAVARSEAARIGLCLGQLEPGRAQAVRGAYLEGWSYQELAERADVPLNTMRTWLRRSLIKLRECLSG
ncbi:MAG: sigma-70 family RNA polymerase sigma factor [Celeribacter sp.]|jgi:RNA polymerase sigma-70 factor (ECF subfamily)